MAAFARRSLAGAFGGQGRVATPQLEAERAIDRVITSYTGAVGPFAKVQGFAWALDRDGAYVGGTDRDTDQHLLFLESGKLVGILKYRLHPIEVHLAHLVVAPENRGSGVGGHLLDAFLSAVASDPRLHEMVVTCEIKSAEPDKVARMLTKRGFKCMGFQWQFQL